VTPLSKLAIKSFQELYSHTVSHQKTYYLKCFGYSSCLRIHFHTINRHRFYFIYIWCQTLTILIFLQIFIIDVWWSLQVTGGSYKNRPSKQRYSSNGCGTGGNWLLTIAEMCQYFSHAWTRMNRIKFICF